MAISFNRIAKKVARENSVEGMKKRLESLYNIVPLTQDQKREVEAYRTQFEKESTALHVELANKEEELMKLYMRKEIDILTKNSNLILKEV